MGTTKEDMQMRDLLQEREENIKKLIGIWNSRLGYKWYLSIELGELACWIVLNNTRLADTRLSRSYTDLTKHQKTVFNMSGVSQNFGPFAAGEFSSTSEFFCSKVSFIEEVKEKKQSQPKYGEPGVYYTVHDDEKKVCGQNIYNYKNRLKTSYTADFQMMDVQLDLITGD